MFSPRSFCGPSSELLDDLRERKGCWSWKPFLLQYLGILPMFLLEMLDIISRSTSCYRIRIQSPNQLSHLVLRRSWPIVVIILSDLDNLVASRHTADQEHQQENIDHLLRMSEWSGLDGNTEKHINKGNQWQQGWDFFYYRTSDLNI